MRRGTANTVSDDFDVDRSGRFAMWTADGDNIVGDRRLLTVIQNWKAPLGR